MHAHVSRPALLALVLAAGAASACDDRGQFDWANPGGPGGGGGGGPDAASGGVDAGLDRVVSGRVCALSELRQPTMCNPIVDLSLVEIGERESAATTTAAADGRFTLATGGTVRSTLQVARTAPDLVPSLVPIPLVDGRAAGVIAPVMDGAEWNALLLAVGTVDPAGDASIAVYVVDRATGDPVTGASITPPAGTIQPVFYDTEQADVWTDLGGTGPFGAALLTSVPAAADTTTLTVDAPGRRLTLSDVPVAPDTLTFVTAALP